MSFSNPIESLNDNANSFVNPDNITLKTNPDGSENAKYIDLLDEDRPVAGQKFTCLSFFSPEKNLKRSTHYFLASWQSCFKIQTAQNKSRINQGNLCK